MRQVAGAFAKYEKTRLVEKVAAVRRRKREDAGRCEGGKTRLQRLEELRQIQMRPAETPAVAVQDRRRAYLNERGRPYNPNSIKLMLGS
jgi:hypothetical protein